MCPFDRRADAPGPLARATRYVPLTAILLTAVLGACGKGEPSAGTAKKAAGAVPVMVVQAERKSVPLRLQAIGNVEAYASVGIKSRVDGQIVQVAYRDGQDVERGQLLFRIDPRPFQAALNQAEATLLRDRAQLERALAQEKRYKELLERNFISKDAYAQFLTNVATTQATARASEAAVETAKLQLDYSAIRSPIAGRTGKTLIQLGNVVKANDSGPLLVINQLSPIYLDFALPEQHLGAIRQAMSQHRLKVEATAGDATGVRQEGELSFIDNAVDPSTGTVKLRATFPNATRTLWPGQFATATLMLGVQADALVVPSQAVQTSTSGQYVYVINADDVADLRPVSVERVDGEQTIVAKGLEAGERVVTVGQLRLSPGAKVRIATASPSGAPVAEPAANAGGAAQR